MSSNKMATKADLQEMYARILPYLGGSADAGFTPIGTIIAVFSESAPANYLICNGATYNKADYPELAAHLLALTTHSQYEVSGDSTKFKVPDLRGEFLRGTGTNGHTNCGNGANVGVHQTPTGHLFDDQDGTNKCFGVMGINGQATVPSNVDSALGTGNVRAYVAASDQYSTTGTLRYSSRPTNTSVLFCIATKNIYLNPENDYSTDEKVVGTWVTGETIYQKTVMINAVPSSGNALWVQIEPTLDVVVDYSAIVYSDVWSSVVDSISTQDATSSSYFKVYVYNYKWTDNPGCAVLLNNIATTGWDDKKAFITVKYTKKTS